MMFEAALLLMMHNASCIKSPAPRDDIDCKFEVQGTTPHWPSITVKDCRGNKLHGPKAVDDWDHNTGNFDQSIQLCDIQGGQNLTITITYGRISETVPVRLQPQQCPPCNENGRSYIHTKEPERHDTGNTSQRIRQLINPNWY